MCTTFLLQGWRSCSEYANIPVCVAHHVITLLERRVIRTSRVKTTCRSATVIASIWQLCFPCPLVWVLPKNNFKMKKKNSSNQSNVEVPPCVRLCCKTHFAVLCQWLLLQHSEPASFTACDQNTHSGPPYLSQKNTWGQVSVLRWSRWPMCSSCDVWPPHLQNTKKKKKALSSDPQNYCQCI